MELRTFDVTLDTYAMAYLIKVVGENEVGTTSSDELLLDTIKYGKPISTKNDFLYINVTFMWLDFATILSEV